MTLLTQHTVNAPATLSDEQRRRVSDALENAQSENTRRNYAGQYRKFRDWCEREKQSALPASPEVVAAYAAELVDDGKSMSTVRLAVSAIVDAHRRVGLESPVNAGLTEPLRGLVRRVGASQKQAKPLDADALAAIRATAFTPCRSLGGSVGTEATAMKRGRLEIALASVLYDAGLRVSEAAQLIWRDMSATVFSGFRVVPTREHKPLCAIVCGGRDFDDVALLEGFLRTVSLSRIIHGAARGADTLAADFRMTLDDDCSYHGWAEVVYPVAS